MIPKEMPKMWKDYMGADIDDPDERRDCIHYLKGDPQDVFAWIAKNDPEYFVRSEAIEKLTIQSVLEDIVKNAETDSERAAAAYRIKNGNLLCEIIKKKKESQDVRKSAILALDSEKWENFFLEIIKNKEELLILRATAFQKYNLEKREKLYDEKELENVTELHGRMFYDD